MIGATLVVALAAALHLLLPSAAETPTAFLAILALALAYGVARATSGNPGSFPRAIGVALGIASVALGLHFAAGHLLPTPVAPPVPTWLGVFVSAAFIALFLFQALLWRACAHPVGRRLYVHALSGFYVGAVANRFLNRLWPSHQSN